MWHLSNCLLVSSVSGLKWRWWQFPSLTFGRSCWFWFAFGGKCVGDSGPDKIRNTFLVVWWGKKWPGCKVSEVIGPLPASNRFWLSDLQVLQSHSYNMSLINIQYIHKPVLKCYSLGWGWAADLHCWLSFRALTPSCCHCCQGAHGKTRFCQEPGTDKSCSQRSDFCTTAPSSW